MSESYYLGPLVGDTWFQYADSDGQVYYYDSVTGESTFYIPSGWEDDDQVNGPMSLRSAYNKLTTLFRMHGIMITLRGGNNGMCHTARFPGSSGSPILSGEQSNRKGCS